MSTAEGKPLHWIPDVGGAQAEENLALLEWAQRSRSRRMGLRSAEIAEEEAKLAAKANREAGDDPEPER